MTALAVIAAMATALCVGYYAGRRTGSPASARKRRSRRIALGRFAVSVIVVMVSRRIRRQLKTVEPLLFSRVRRRSRRPMTRWAQLTRA
ncbi:hypothetical protein [Mycobacterium angelicum]|uniref:Uncharacterized protein n=1 Tax=Mycobacterium angelicum TaxID=470074 RepID=A0A1W9ZXY2_MYCAN|nr:hypothetical protein [Mycobacterium angelicum]MCV7195243.1 hypothetical protein [Mycobacterium angelicum]ORA22667.1 hypothetical protein BST12_08795 [Mycobacterium angelicum]